MTQIIGPSVVTNVSNMNGAGSNVQTFINFLADPASQIPLESNFLIIIEDIPNALQSAFPSGFENYWSTENTRQTILQSLQSTVHTPLGGQVCLWAQGIKIPGESIGFNRPDNASGGPTGGLLTGVVTTGRNQYSTPLELAILETNASFVDFVMRPWVSLVGHYGLITRASTSSQSVKTKITCVLFDKNNANAIRKIFTFRGAAPVSISDETYAYGNENVKIFPVNFVYNTYSIEEVTSGGSW